MVNDVTLTDIERDLLVDMADEAQLEARDLQTVIAVLVERLGGEVTITPAEVFRARSYEAWRNMQTLATTFRLDPR